MFNNLIRCCLLIICIIVLLPQIEAQTRVSNQNLENLEKVANKMPENKRNRLIQRYLLYFEYQNKRDWSHMYDLIGESLKESSLGEFDREKFVKSQKESIQNKLKEFKIQEMQMVENFDKTQHWIITGCGIYKSFPTSQKLMSSLGAYYTNDEWYFSQIGVIAKCIDCEDLPCSK